MPRRRRDDAGMVTAETAVALPALVVVLCLVLWAVAAGLAQLRCVDAARAGALAAARGESPAAVLAIVTRTAPRGSRIQIHSTSGTVTVSVSARVAPPGVARLSVPVHGDATAEREPATGTLP